MVPSRDREREIASVLPTSGRRQLLKVLGTWDSAAIGIGVAIGAGIFRTPGYVAGFLDAPWKILAIWVIGGLLVLGDCLVLSELATRVPRAGGWYAYIERGLGRFAAFVYGWAFIAVVDAASTSALVVALGEFLAGLFGLAPGVGRGLAIVVTLLIFGLSLAGVRVGSRAQNALTYLKLGALALLGAAAFFLPAAVPGGDSGGITPAVGGLTLFAAFGLALQGVLWTFDGYANTTTMTEESEDPGRMLPRALIGGTLALALVYLLVNAAYLHVLGRDALAASQVPGSDLMARLFGPAGRSLFLVVAILAALGSLNGAVLSAPRVAYALARSGFAPGPFTIVSRGGTPWVATLWFAVSWTVFTLLGTFEGLVSVAAFIGALANVIVTASLFRLRSRDVRPEGGRVFLCPGYPVVPAVLLVTWAAFAATVLRSLGWKVGYGLALTALALPIYLWLRRGGAHVDRADGRSESGV